MALKQSNKRRAKAKLGSKWVEYWDAIHAGSHTTFVKVESSTHESNQTESNFSTSSDSNSGPAISTRDIDSSQNPLDMIEVNPNSGDRYLWQSSKPTQTAASSFTSAAEAILAEAGTTMAVEENHDELPNIIEIKQEPKDGSLKLPNQPNQGNLIEPDSSSSGKVPDRILAKAKLNGQSYFTIKWKGPYEDELGLWIFLFFLFIF